MDELKRLMPYIPSRLREEIVALGKGYKIEEIRLRRGMPLSLTIQGKNLRGQGCMTDEEAEDVLLRICGGSLHAHTETLKEGFITLPGGIRVGVVGLATVKHNQIEAIRDISSISFRIPRIVHENGAVIIDYLESVGYASGVLVFSLPGEGKTTLLREIAIRLSSAPHLKRVALIDTRRELYNETAFRSCLCDVLSGYPKAEGISIAVRCLSPQFLLCDEIGGDAEANAILAAQPSGVPLIASVHGSEAEEIITRPAIASLIAHGVFGMLFRLNRNGSNLRITPFPIQRSMRT